MKLNVRTYGDVSPSFSSLTSEIVRNATERMEMPPLYTLHICKNMSDYRTVMSKIEGKAASIHTRAGSSFSESPAQTVSLFDCPETVLVEDDIMKDVETLEGLEGVVVHEQGHAEDYWKNGILSLTFPSLSSIAPAYASGEYRAEKNAIDAGYNSGCLASRAVTIKNIMSNKEGIDFRYFLLDLSSLGWKSAFMHSPKPPAAQKECLDALWTKLVKSRKLEQNRKLLSNKEAAERPDLFVSEKNLENFALERMKEYGLRDGLLIC